MGNFVYTFHSGMPGANQLSAAGAAGSLAAILYQCGVTGFAGGVLDSLTRSGTTATATRSAGLNLADGLAGMPHIVKITGSSNGWDGEYLLDSAPGSTSCTFQVPNTLPTPATGTITLVRAPAGLSRVFSASNLEVWRAPDTGTLPGYILLDDSAADRAGFRLAETAAATVDYATMVGLCPTVAQVSGAGGIARKTNGSGASKPWVLRVWKGGIDLFVDWNNGGFYEWIALGAKLTRKAGDGYPGFIMANTSFPAFINGNSNALSKNPGVTTTQWGQFVQRAHGQSGSSIAFVKAGGFPLTNLLGTGGNPNGNGPDGKRDFWGPLAMIDGTGTSNADISGYLPGIYDPVNCGNANNLDVFSSVDALPGRKLLFVKLGAAGGNGGVALDITGNGNGGF